MSEASTAFELKSASLNLLSIVLKTNDLYAIQKLMRIRFAEKDLKNERFILDLSAFKSVHDIELMPVISLAAQYGIKILAIRHDDNSFATLAHKYNFIYQSASIKRSKPEEAKIPSAKSSTMLVKTPVRTGQQIYAKNSDLIVLASVSAGAEIIADGNIHVYSTLRGRALAGANGNRDAIIFVQAMQAELVSIAGVYRAIEQKLPSSIQDKPTQIFLDKNRIIMKSMLAE